jgi:hypothetical protein
MRERRERQVEARFRAMLKRGKAARGRRPLAKIRRRSAKKKQPKT